MPLPSRWMIKLALVYMIAGFAIGAAMLFAKGYPAYSRLFILLPIHIEISIFGWIVQLTMGTAYWILPRYLEDHSRGSAWLAKLMIVVFNGGILLNVLTYLNVIPKQGTLVGRLMEVAAVIMFVALHWNRAVSYRS